MIEPWNVVPPWEHKHSGKTESYFTELSILVSREHGNVKNRSGVPCSNYNNAWKGECV